MNLLSTIYRLEPLWKFRIKNNRIKKLLTNKTLMQRKFGKSIAQKINDCLDFMETAIDFGEVCQDKSYRATSSKRC